MYIDICCQKNIDGKIKTLLGKLDYVD